jgi:hypothetical protein
MDNDYWNHYGSWFHNRFSGLCFFIVDKVIAFKIKLLTDEMSNQLFDLIKTLTLMIFSYYFGTQKKGEDSEKK